MAFRGFCSSSAIHKQSHFMRDKRWAIKLLNLSYVVQYKTDNLVPAQSCNFNKFKVHETKLYANFGYIINLN